MTQKGIAFLRHVDPLVLVDPKTAALCLNNLSGALTFMLRSNIKVNAPYPVECIDFPDLGTLGFILY